MAAKQIDLELIKRIVDYYNSLDIDSLTADLRTIEDIADTMNAEGYSVQIADVRSWIMQSNLVLLHGYSASKGGVAICKQHGCIRLASTAKGLCHKHYARLRKYGNPETKHKTGPPKIHTNTICKIDGCDKAASGSSCGYCSMHYQRIKKTGSPHIVRKRGRKPGIHWWGKA